MPTVARINALRVVVYPNDHRPAHVHVIGAGCEAVYDLNCPSGPPAIRECYGFSIAKLATIGSALEANLEYLCREWSRIHESY